MKYPTLARKGFIIPNSTSPRSKGVRIGAFNGEYEGASTGRRLGTWSTFASGPNLSDAATLSAIRARARDAIRNNPWAAQALNSFASNLVGRGIVPRWKIENEELRQQIHSLWEEWVQESDADGLLDFYGQQTLVTKTVIHSGEAIIRFRPRRLSDGLSVPLQLQVLEPDFLDEYKDGPAPSGNTYHQGIEFNSIGQRVRYWLRKQHPGDSFFMSGQLESVPVPASQVLHVYRVDRPGQLRGVSWFAPVLARMFLLDQYEDAELDRKKTAALFGVFITKSGDLAGPGGLVGFDSDTNVDANNRPFADLEPGMMNYLLPGEDVKFSTPADVGGSYEVWLTRQLQAIAAGIGVTYEQLTGDFSKVNFSSARGRMVEFRRVCRQIIGSMINFQFNQKVAQVWLATAVASGALKIPDFATNRRQYLKIDWRMDGWEWVNPREDVLTAKEEVRAGFRTREDVVTERGGDIDVIDRRNKELNDRMDKYGLVYDSDPRKTSNAGLTQGRPADTSNVDPGKFQDADDFQPLDKSRENGFLLDDSGDDSEEDEESAA